MKSIMHDGTYCYKCGRNGCGDYLEWHHIFDGPNRKFSEKYGLKVRLCGNRCHRNGKEAVHGLDTDYRHELEAKAQQAFIDANPELDFFSIFGKNYI